MVMEYDNIYYAVDIDGEVSVKSDSEVSEIGHGCKIIGRVCTFECDTSCMAYCSGTCPFVCMKDSAGNWIHVRKEVGYEY